MKATKKFWAKVEEAKLADYTGQEIPVDPFKKEYHKRKSSVEITEKPNKKWEPQHENSGASRMRS